MVLGKTWCIGQQNNTFYLSFIASAEQCCWSFIPFPCSSVKYSSHFLLTCSYTCARYRFDMSIEEAAELGRRAIYHATFRDGASGGVASGTPPPLSSLSSHLFACACLCTCMLSWANLWFQFVLCKQFIMWEQMDGPNYLAMMSQSSTTNTIQLCQLKLQSRTRWLKHKVGASLLLFPKCSSVSIFCRWHFKLSSRLSSWNPGIFKFSCA
jgi:hypothetical protein